MMLVRLLSYTVAAATVVSAKLNDPQERKLQDSYDKCLAECDSLLSGSITCKVVGYTDADKSFVDIGTATCAVEDCSPQVGFGGATCTGVDLSVCPNGIVVNSKLTCSTSGTGFVCPSNCSDPTTRCKTVCAGDCPTKECKVIGVTEGSTTETLIDLLTCTCSDCDTGEDGNVFSCTAGDISKCDNDPFADLGTIQVQEKCVPITNGFTCDTCKCVGGGDCSSEACCTLADGTKQTCVEKKFKGERKKVCVKDEGGGGGDECASCDCDASVVAKGCFRGKNPCCS